MTRSVFTPSDMASWPRIASEVWAQKYQLRIDGVPVDRTWSDTVSRVARAAASVEEVGQTSRWETAFADVIGSQAFIPGGRILAGAGAGRSVTLFNCFVMGRIDDDLGSIFDNVKEAALTLQMGGGIGHDFSTLRPKGALVRSIGADASGPVSFMDVWDAMCRTIMSAGQRRGAMMATLRCDHPDIETFIEAKRDSRRLRNFNLSVLVTDAFVAAVRARAPWPLVFGGETVRTVDAADLWTRLMRATYDVAEPGVVFIDRVNTRNNLAYCESISATNPCGEQPLPAYGACLLGALNLTRFVVHPFGRKAKFDLPRLEAAAEMATRFLDNIIEVSRYPLERQRREALTKRRLGLGVTGLADALVMLGVRYGSDEAQRLAGQWLGAVKLAAYGTSAGLAREKGAFPLSDGDRLVERPNLKDLPTELRATIRASGLRNGCLTTIAPTGTTSLLAGNVSSGIEPVFAFVSKRRVLGRDGVPHVEEVEDFAHCLYRATHGAEVPLTEAFVTAAGLPPKAHLAMQAAAQAHVDAAISKTINVPQDLPFEAFQSIYLDAFDLGLKGCTTYRPNEVTGAVLVAEPERSTGPTPVAPALTASPAPSSRTSVSASAPAQATALAPAGPDTAVQRPAISKRIERDGAVVYMQKPVERDRVLGGYTYKIRWPRSEHAIYITINDKEIEGRPRPFEIFINSKNLEHYAWTVALTRMISAVFRRGGDVSFVVEELKAVFDPQGGAWIEGRYVPSLLAAIGEVIEAHLDRLDGGARRSDDERRQAQSLGSSPRIAGEDSRPGGVGAGAGTKTGAPWVSRAEGGEVASFNAGGGPVGSAHSSLARACPKCGRPTYLHVGGCWTCDTCHFSQCE